MLKADELPISEIRALQAQLSDRPEPLRVDFNLLQRIDDLALPGGGLTIAAAAGERGQWRNVSRLTGC